MKGKEKGSKKLSVEQKSRQQVSRIKSTGKLSGTEPFKTEFSETEPSETKFSKAEPFETESSRAELSGQTSGTKTSQSLLLQDITLLLLKIFILGVMAAVLLLFVFGLTRCADMSMSPAIKDGDVVLYYRLDKDYHQNDVVVADIKGQIQIRRVVAIAGDTVDITENGLMVNGAIQQESSIYEKTQRYTEGIDFPVTLKQGEVFLLGDSREHSTDSRIYGPVNRKDTRGKVMTIIRRRGI